MVLKESKIKRLFNFQMIMIEYSIVLISPYAKYPVNPIYIPLVSCAIYIKIDFMKNIDIIVGIGPLIDKTHYPLWMQVWKHKT
jgi:hypothetical protein